MKIAVYMNGEKYEFTNHDDAVNAVKMAGTPKEETSVQIEICQWNDSLGETMKVVTQLHALGCVVNTEVPEKTMKEKFGFRTVAELREGVAYFAKSITVAMDVV